MTQALHVGERRPIPAPWSPPVAAEVMVEQVLVVANVDDQDLFADAKWPRDAATLLGLLTREGTPWRERHGWSEVLRPAGWRASARHAPLAETTRTRYLGIQARMFGIGPSPIRLDVFWRDGRYDHGRYAAFGASRPIGIRDALTAARGATLYGG